MPDQLFYTAQARFEAARQVTLLPPGHRARRLHGHSFLARVRTTEAVPPAPFPGAESQALQEGLEAVTAALDYTLLNERLDEPSDENLARWIRHALAVEALESIGIQSTRNAGVDLERNDTAHIWRRYRFEAAHRLPNVAPNHKCGRMHGHSFEVILHARQALQGQSMGIDYDHLDRLWAPLAALLDHRCLNTIAGLENPTSEMLSSWIWERLWKQLPELAWVTVYETASCGAHFDGSRYRIWKDLSLDSAVRLRHAGAGDPRHAIHGHTFTLRLHCAAPLDVALGWTVDFGVVREAFMPLFEQLDHRPLYELEGLADNDCASIARWIRHQAAAALPEIDRVDLFDASGAGVIVTAVGDDPALAL